MTCCSPSQTTALFPALFDHHPLQLHLSWTFCIISVSILPHICQTDRYVSSVFQKWRKYGQNQSGYLWPELTAINVVNHPLSCDKSPSFCDCGLLCGNSHCTDQLLTYIFYFTCPFYFVIIFVWIISNLSPELFGRLRAGFLRLLSTCNLNVSYHHIWLFWSLSNFALPSGSWCSWSKFAMIVLVSRCNSLLSTLDGRVLGLVALFDMILTGKSQISLQTCLVVRRRFSGSRVGWSRLLKPWSSSGGLQATRVKPSLWWYQSVSCRKRNMALSHYDLSRNETHKR